MAAPTLKSYLKKITGLPKWARYPIYFIAFALVALTAIAIFAPGLPPEEKAKNKREKVLREVTAAAKEKYAADRQMYDAFITLEMEGYDRLVKVPDTDSLKMLAIEKNPGSYTLQSMAYSRLHTLDSLYSSGKFRVMTAPKNRSEAIAEIKRNIEAEYGDDAQTIKQVVSSEIEHYDILAKIPDDDPNKIYATYLNPKSYYTRYYSYLNGHKRDSLKRLGLSD